MGGATLTLKDRMSSGGSLSLGLLDGMNETSERTGLGIAVCCNECYIISAKSYHPNIQSGMLGFVNATVHNRLRTIKLTFYICLYQH